MLGSHGSWFYSHLGGIRLPDNSIGWSTVTIAPTMTKKLRGFSARLATWRGNISTSWAWKKEDSGDANQSRDYVLNVSVPVGTVANVSLGACVDAGCDREHLQVRECGLGRCVGLFESGAFTRNSTPEAEAEVEGVLSGGARPGSGVWVAVGSGDFSFAVSAVTFKKLLKADDAEAAISAARGGVRYSASDKQVQLLGRWARNASSGSAAADWSGSTILFAVLMLPGAATPQVELSGASQWRVYVDRKALSSIVSSAPANDAHSGRVLLPWETGQAGAHTIMITKMNEALCSPAVFCGVVLPAGGVLQPPPPRPTRRLVFLGDSITCGYGSLGWSGKKPGWTPPSCPGYNCGADASAKRRLKPGKGANWESADASYAALLGRHFNADVQNICISGAGFAHAWQSNTTSATHNGLSERFDYVLGSGTNASSNAVDPASWTPDGIVINVGTNDGAVPHANGSSIWVTTYLSFLKKWRKAWPQTTFFLGCFPMTKLAQMQPAVKLVAKLFNDDQIHVLSFPTLHAQYAKGCYGHPSVEGHQLMANLTGAVLANTLGWKSGLLKTTDIAAVLPLVGAPALDNGLGKTPMLAWSSWNAFGDISKLGNNFNETALLAIADVQSQKMLQAGYTYFNVDAGWAAPNRTASGELQPHPRLFPRGMKAFCDSIRAKGLRCGLYTGYARQVCSFGPGSWQHEAQDAKTFASWGVDYLKDDWCFNKAGSVEAGAKQAFIRMRNALNATGRKILYSIHGKNVTSWTSYYKDSPSICNAWRVGGDIEPPNRPTWAGILRLIDGSQWIFDKYPHLSGPGRFNDMDMMVVGQGLPLAQDRAHLALWAMLASPIAIGFDLRNADYIAAAQQTIKDATNAHLMLVARDDRAQQATLVASCSSQSRGVQLFVRKLMSGTIAVVVLHRGGSNSSSTVVCALASLGVDCGPRHCLKPVVDVWSPTAPTATYDDYKLKVFVAPKAAGFYLLVPSGGAGTSMKTDDSHDADDAESIRVERQIAQLQARLSELRSKKKSERASAPPPPALPSLLYVHKKTYATADPLAAAQFVVDNLGGAGPGGNRHTCGNIHGVSFPGSGDKSKGQGDLEMHFVFNPHKQPGPVYMNATDLALYEEHLRSKSFRNNTFDQFIDNHVGLVVRSLDPFVSKWKANNVSFVCRTWCCAEGMKQWPTKCSTQPHGADCCPAYSYNRTSGCEVGCYVEVPHGIIMELQCGFSSYEDSLACLTVVKPDVFDLCSSKYRRLQAKSDDLAAPAVSKYFGEWAAPPAAVTSGRFPEGELIAQCE